MLNTFFFFADFLFFSITARIEPSKKVKDNIGKRYNRTDSKLHPIKVWDYFSVLTEINDLYGILILRATAQLINQFQVVLGLVI